MRDLRSRMATRTRQSKCEYEAEVFSCCYAVALNLIKDELADSGIILNLAQAGNCFWLQRDDNGDTPTVPVLDVAFVDDECVMLRASSPTILNTSINALLPVLHKVFGLMKLEINWKPGKTECFLVYRRKKSPNKREER